MDWEKEGTLSLGGEKIGIDKGSDKGSDKGFDKGFDKGSETFGHADPGMPIIGGIG